MYRKIRKVMYRSCVSKVSIYNKYYEKNYGKTTKLKKNASQT